MTSILAHRNEFLIRTGTGACPYDVVPPCHLLLATLRFGMTAPKGANVL